LREREGDRIGRTGAGAINCATAPPRNPTNQLRPSIVHYFLSTAVGLHVVIPRLGII
jgi:hypothetical protein